MPNFSSAMFGTWSYDQFIEKVLEFHGHVAPGVVLGAFMVEAARRQLPQGTLFDAVSETVQCLPDSIQLLTPCTIGNGWLRIHNFGIFALSLYDKYTGHGVRVHLDPEKLPNFPHVRSWFLKEKPKKEQDSAAIMQEIRDGGFDMLATMPIQLLEDKLKRKGKGAIRQCPRCGEYYPAVFGDCCRPCQGAGPYAHWPVHSS